MTTLYLRPATPDDKPFVRSLLPQFTAFGLPLWRNEDAIQVQFEGNLLTVLDSLPKDTVFLIAEDEFSQAIGFVYVTTEQEHFTGERVGYVSDVAVAPSVQGRGIGKQLMQAAEEWAREQGYRYLTLTVFSRNTRARELYERLGYIDDTLKLVKVLS